MCSSPDIQMSLMSGNSENWSIVATTGNILGNVNDVLNGADNSLTFSGIAILEISKITSPTSYGFMYLSLTVVGATNLSVKFTTTSGLSEVCHCSVQYYLKAQQLLRR